MENTLLPAKKNDVFYLVSVIWCCITELVDISSCSRKHRVSGARHGGGLAHPCSHLILLWCNKGSSQRENVIGKAGISLQFRLQVQNTKAASSNYFILAVWFTVALFRVWLKKQLSWTPLGRLKMKIPGLYPRHTESVSLWLLRACIGTSLSASAPWNLKTTAFLFPKCFYTWFPLHCLQTPRGKQDRLPIFPYYKWGCTETEFHLLILFVFFVDGTGVWTQGFTIVKQVVLLFVPCLQSILLWLFWRWGCVNYLPRAGLELRSSGSQPSK
jgi:hypothetical protein